MSFMDVDQIDFSPPPSAPRGPSAGGSYGRGPRRASHGRGRGRGGQPLPRATPNLTYRNPQIQIQTQQGQALHIRARGQGRGRVGRTQFLRQDFDGLPDAEPKYPLHPPISLGAKQYNPQEDLENLPDAGTDARPLRNLPSDRLRRQQQQRWPPLGEHPSLYADPNNYPPFPPLIVSDIESESGGDDYQDRFVPQIPQPHSQAYQSQGQTAPNFFLPTQLRSIRQRSQPQQREPHYHQQFPTDVNPGFSQDYVNRRTPPQPRLRERPEQTLDPNTPEPKGQENLEKVFFSAIGSGIGVLKKSRGKVDHQVCHNLVERALQRVEQEAGRSASDFLSPSHKDAFIKILVTEILRPRAHVSVESSLSLVGTWYENARKPANLFQAQSFSTPEPTVTPRTAFITPPMDNSALLQFLSIIDGLIAGRNGDQLSQFIVIEPDPQGNFPQDYASLIQSIRSGFPPNSDDALEKLCSIHLPTARKGADEIPWNEFVRFIVGYLRYLTLADVQNLLQTFNLVSDLVQKCSTALKHPVLGIVVLPTVVACSRALARFAINLDKNPHLIANVNRTSSEEGGDSIPERCANIIRGAFTECFKDRSGPPSGVTNGRPDGKRVGIYLLVNLCLRILFQCRKLEAAHIIFDQISQNSPPLDVYPKAQQITYLYYLGRFHFTTSHFYSAQAALNAALDLCPKSAYTPIECRHQRRLISIYLIASNIVVGRFPSVTLWARLDVDDLRPRFEPLYTAIRKGDLASFRRLTSIDSPEAPFFLRYRILLQLRNRCEVLVWRSILRRTFLLAGQAGDPENRRAPTLELSYVLQLLQWMEKRALMPITINDAGPGNRNTNWIFMENAQPAKQTRYIDPDFEDPDNPGKSILDEYNEDREDESGPLLPNMLEVEAICAALVNQGLLKGFVSHRLKRFAIQGARTKGALAAGWPRVWDVMREREREENPQGVVPGWKRETPAANGLGGAARFGGASAPGPGTVVRLTGARPVGVGP